MFNYISTIWDSTKKHKHFQLIFYALLGTFFLWSSKLTYFQAVVREQYTDPNFINTLCADSSKSPPLGLSKDMWKDICKPLPDKYKIDKFLLFATDCWPVAEAKDVFDYYKEHGHYFKVDIPGAKYSHAIYTSYMTGQLPTNYKGDPIQGDHLVKAMQRSPTYKKRLQYIGPEWSFLAIFGKENYDEFYADVRVEPEPLDVNFEHVYPWFFERAGYMNTYFNELVANNRSMLSHSAVYDHRQHGEHRALGPTGVDFPYTKKIARAAQADFKTLRSWFDSHPEYTLVMFSDHGVDEFHLGGYRMHGLTENGNEPWVLLYNKNFSPNGGPKRIDVVDVAPTLAQYFKGVDIPAGSMGVSYTHLEKDIIGANDVRLACRNALQLYASALNRKRSVDGKQLASIITAAVASIHAAERNDLNHANATAKAHAQIREWLFEVKEEMYSALDLPWQNILIYSIVSMVATLFVVVVFNPRLDQFIMRDEFRRFLWELMRVFAIYTVAYCQLMYIYEGWLWTHNDARLWRVMAPLMSFVLLRVLDRLPPTEPLTLCRHLLYQNAFVFCSALILSTSFHELIGFANEYWPAMTTGRPILLLVGLKAIRAYYLRAESSQNKAYEQRCLSERNLGNERYEATTTRPLLSNERRFVSFLFVCVMIYCWTDDVEAMYQLGSWFNALFGVWHVAALIVLLSTFLFLPVYLLFFANRMNGTNGELLPYSGVERLIVPLTLLLALLNKDSVSNQFCLLLMVWQLEAVVVPLYQNLIHIQQASSAPAIIRKPFGGNLAKSYVGKLAIALQATGVLALTIPFFAGSVYFRDPINFDVHPFAGRIGMKDYDAYPLLSAFFMLLHKYGIYMIYAVYSATMARRPPSWGPDARLRELAPPPPVKPDTQSYNNNNNNNNNTTQRGLKSRHASQGRLESSHHAPDDARHAVDIEPRTTHRRDSSAVLHDSSEPVAFEWVPTQLLAMACRERHAHFLSLFDAQLATTHTIALLSLYVGMMNVGLYLMLSLITSRHAREEALAASLLFATIAAVHCFTRVLLSLHAVWNERRNR